MQEPLAVGSQAGRQPPATQKAPAGQLGSGPEPQTPSGLPSKQIPHCCEPPSGSCDPVGKQVPSFVATTVQRPS